MREETRVVFVGGSRGHSLSLVLLSPGTGFTKSFPGGEVIIPRHWFSDDLPVRQTRERNAFNWFLY